MGVEITENNHFMEANGIHQVGFTSAESLKYIPPVIPGVRRRRRPLKTKDRCLMTAILSLSAVVVALIVLIVVRVFTEGSERNCVHHPVPVSGGQKDHVIQQQKQNHEQQRSQNGGISIHTTHLGGSAVDPNMGRYGDGYTPRNHPSLQSENGGHQNSHPFSERRGFKCYKVPPGSGINDNQAALSNAVREQEKIDEIQSRMNRDKDKKGRILNRKSKLKQRKQMKSRFKYKTDEKFNKGNKDVEVDSDDYRSMAEHPGDLCLTLGCLRAAVGMVNAMHASADPCTNMWEYACGGWLRAHHIPEAEKVWGVDSVVKESVYHKLRDLLDGNSDEMDSNSNLLLSFSDSLATTSKINSKVAMKALKEEDEENDNNIGDDSVEKAWRFYNSCMDTDTIETRGAQPLLTLIQRLGGWNAIGTANGSVYSQPDVFLKTLQTLHLQYGIDTFFTIWVDADDRNSSANIIQFDQAGLKLPDRTYYFRNASDPVLVAYRQYIGKVASLLGATQANARQFANDVIQFEAKLATIFVAESSFERSDPEQAYYKITLAEFTQLCPAIDWLKLLTPIFPGVTRTTHVLVTSRGYFRKLSSLLVRTNERLLHEYMVWKLIDNFIQHLSEEFGQTHLKFQTTLTGATKTKARWKKCIGTVTDWMGIALGAMFSRKHFHESSQQDVTEMVGLIKHEFVNRLKRLHWMDSKTKTAAKKKAHFMKSLIGYQDFALNTEKLNEYYRNYSIPNGSSYMDNLQAAAYGNVLRMVASLETPVDKSDWDMAPHSVNAYYSFIKNHIVLPAGILQPPFYDKDQPAFVNFGAIGATIGHELTHGFDVAGAQFDEDGNLRRWWTDRSWDTFKLKTKCLSHYYTSKQHVNGDLTLGENIADIGGIILAYKAYRRWIRFHGDEKPLPGLNLTNEQSFFVAYAQSWCTNRRAKSLQEVLISDVHSPEMVRVNGPLSHIGEFAHAFKCPKDSFMNPAHKCHIW